MKKVKDILKSKKQQDIITINSSSMVIDVLRLMADKGIGALPVVEYDELVGIISERDYARKVALAGISSHSTPVRDIMTSSVIVVSPEHTMEACMELMTEKRIRHLPIVEEGKLVGMISIGDLVKNIIEDQRAMIEQLEKYIRGETP